MPWIKRNLFFVVSIAVAVVLMGVAGWLVFSNMGKDTQIQEDLNQQVNEAQRLFNSPAFPSDENIEEAKQQQADLKKFREELKGVFTPAPSFPKMDDRKFNGYVTEFVLDLTDAAGKANVSLPSPFNFTFTPHRTRFQFPTNSIEGWLIQMADIRAICDVLYDAHVNALDSIQRVSISVEVDTGASEYITDATIMTNKAGTTFAPYKVSFRSFGGELAGALEGFSRSTNCIIVKAVNVVPSTIPLPMASTPAPPTAATQRVFIPAQPAVPVQRPHVPQGGAEPALAGGGKGGGYPTSTPTVTAAPVIIQRAVSAAVAAPVTILKEQPLQVTLILEVIRLGQSK